MPLLLMYIFRFVLSYTDKFWTIRVSKFRQRKWEKKTRKKWILRKQKKFRRLIRLKNVSIANQFSTKKINKSIKLLWFYSVWLYILKYRRLPVKFCFLSSNEKNQKQKRNRYTYTYIYHLVCTMDIWELVFFVQIHKWQKTTKFK